MCTLYSSTEIIEEFLKNFKAKRGVKKYVRMLKEVANRERVTVDIELDDLKKYDKNKAVIDHIEANTLRYVGLFSKAIDNVMPDRDASAQVEEDSIDVLADWRYTAYTPFAVHLLISLDITSYIANGSRHKK